MVTLQFIWRWQLWWSYARIFNRCGLDDSSDDESDDESYKCDNVRNNEDCSDKRLDCDEDLSKEDKYDEILITGDDIYDLIGGYEINDSSIEVEDEVTVLFCN